MRRYGDQEQTTLDVYVGQIGDLLTNALEEIRRGQEPILLTEAIGIDNEPRPVYVMPHQIAHFHDYAGSTRTPLVLLTLVSGDSLIVKETMQQIAQKLIRGGYPLS